jgi:hypothetical protein
MALPSVTQTPRASTQARSEGSTTPLFDPAIAKKVPSVQPNSISSARKSPYGPSYYRVSKPLDDGRNLQLEQISGPETAPKTIAITIPEFHRIKNN